MSASHKYKKKKKCVLTPAVQLAAAWRKPLLSDKYEVVASLLDLLCFLLGALQDVEERRN
jgi:hypothetical protein